MSAPKPDRRGPEQPTADDLAGIPVAKEEKNPAMRLRGGRARGRGGIKVRGTPPASPPGPPSADDLAGIPVSAEGNEEVMARPRKPRRRK
jgi:hypothetical protein